jgi:hypothetical protein
MHMRMNLFAAVATAAFILPLAASAQGIVGGASEGARDGSRAAGPVGAVVGGVAGAVGGGVAGLLGVDQQPRFRDYAVRERHQSFTYDRPVVVGGVLPGEGVTYYEVPAEYGVQDYRYAIINGRTVLVNPKTHSIVQVIE